LTVEVVSFYQLCNSEEQVPDQVNSSFQS
jgi:hypothetical protein